MSDETNTTEEETTTTTPAASEEPQGTSIDDATPDTSVGGGEKMPISDGGVPKSLDVDQIKDYVLANLSTVDEASSTNISADGVYIRQGDAVKRLPETLLAQAVMNYAFALTGIVTPNGNELFAVDDSGTKKTITLAQLTEYITANYAAVFASLDPADTLAASDSIFVKQGNTVKRGTLGMLAAFVQTTLATFFGSCVNVLTVQDSDKIVVVSGGVTKTMTVAQLKAAMAAVRADVPEETTAGNVPVWADAEGGLDNGLAVQTSVRAQGTADNSSLATEAAIRSAIGTADAALRQAIAAAVEGVGDVDGPLSTTADKVPQWDSTTKKLKDGLSVVTTVGAAGSDSALPTEKAVRAAVTAEETARATAVTAEATARAAADTAEVTARNTAIATATANMAEKTGTLVSGHLAAWNANGKLVDGKGVVTSLGTPGSNDNVPTEKAVRDAIEVVADAVDEIPGGDVVAPQTTTENKVPQWDSTQKKLKDGLAVVTTVGATGSDSAIATEKAIRSAITAAVEATSDGDVKGPLSTTENNVPQWDSATKKLKDGLGVSTSIGDLAVDTKVPTEKAVKTAIAAEATARGTAITSAVEAEATARDAAIEDAVGDEEEARIAADEALGARIDELSAITGPTTTTAGKVPTWSSTNRGLADGLLVQTSVRSTAVASNSAIVTEKAVRDAVDGCITAPVSHNENAIPTWGAANELKAGKSLVTVIASTGSDENIPTEKAVRDALPVAATTAAAGLMTAADKTKLDNLVDTSSVAEIGAALADNDTVVVKQGDTINKKSLLSRFWTYIMGKLTTYKIDDFAGGDDNTDLNASTARHGLCPKLSGDSSHFLRGDGTFAAPTGSTPFTGTDGTADGTQGLVPAPVIGDEAKFLCGNGVWATPPSAAGVDIPGATAIDSLADADLAYFYDASANGYRKVTAEQIRALVMGTKRYDTIFVPAGAMTPSNENGATPGAVGFDETTHDTLAFPSTADKTAEFSVVFPDDWDKSSVKAKALWTFYDSTAGQSGQHVKFLVGAVSCGDGDDISDAPTTFVDITDQAQSANELCKSGASAALTPEGTLANGNLVHFTVGRDADYAPEGGSVLATEALLLGVFIQFGRTANYEVW